MIKYHFALHVYDDSSFARFFTNIYCPDVVGGWVLIGDFVRPSFFFLSHSLSFRSASPKTFERQIYIKQIRRHADVQLDTPLLQRAAEKERKTCPFFFLLGFVNEGKEFPSSCLYVHVRYQIIVSRLRCAQVCSGPALDLSNANTIMPTFRGRCTQTNTQQTSSHTSTRLALPLTTLLEQTGH